MQDEFKAIEWVGSRKEDLRDFPPEARQRAGYQLELIQEGEEPSDWGRWKCGAGCAGDPHQMQR